MEETTPPNLGVPSLAGTVTAARSFGLTEVEVWQAVDESLGRAADDDSLDDSIDDLAAALARRILARTRASVADRRRIAADGL
jgi:hypothetical protein